MDKLLQNYKKFKPLQEKLSNGSWREDPKLRTISTQEAENINHFVSLCEEQGVAEYLVFTYAQEVSKRIMKRFIN